MSARDDARARVEAERQAHRRRPLPVRIAIATGGALALLPALPLALVLPEFGVPLLLFGLRLLALESDAAARAYAWTVWRSAQVLDWFQAAPLLTRAAFIVGLALVALIVIVLTTQIV